MNIRRLNYIVNSGLIITFSLIFATGIIKFPGFLNFFGISYISLSMHRISLIHDWSGVALVILTIIHLIINRRWIFSSLSKQINISGKKIRVWHLIIALIIILTLIFSLYIQERGGDRVKQLRSAEVREYEGEKLSSIVDLEETGIKGTQYIDINDYSLEISGLANNPKNYTYEEVLDFQNYSKVVELHCVVGWKAKILWEGVLLEDLLESVEVKPEAKIAIFYAQDGFSTSLPLDYIKDNDIILAYKINDVVLPPEKGFPFQLVAEQKWGYKWIKWLTKIELSDDLDYKGTYESGGYSNEADITGPKRD